MDLYKHFQLLIEGDIGGFGVGSHFTYSVLGLLGYCFQMFGRAAIAHAGVLEQISYVSTAGGAFLEWLEGKELPGVAALARN